jgi:hypothetical protein
MNTSDVNEAIRQKYGQAAVRGTYHPKSRRAWSSGRVAPPGP